MREAGLCGTSDDGLRLEQGLSLSPPATIWVFSAQMNKSIWIFSAPNEKKSIWVFWVFQFGAGFSDHKVGDAVGDA